MQKLKEFAAFTKNVLSIDEMRSVDANLKDLKVSEFALMDNAGKAVADFIGKKLGSGKRILVVCGKGKNGGDGFVAARYLSKRYKVKVAIVASRNDIGVKETQRHLKLLEESRDIAVIEHAEQFIGELLTECDVVVAAIFGIGFRGRMRDDSAAIIKGINASGKTVFAVDVPSGLSNENRNGPMVKATYTITFHKMKQELLHNKNAGKVVVADIGIPIEAELICGDGELIEAAQPRGLYSSKRDNGRTLIIGGSERFHGAPIHAALSAYTTLAALRIGIGYAVTCVPKYAAPMVKAASPNLIVDKFAGDSLSMVDTEMLKEEIGKAQSVVLGPGIGKSDQSLHAAAELIKYSVSKRKRIIIDADAIFAMKYLKKLNSNVLLTPNDREFAVLSNAKLDSRNLAKRARAAVSVAKKLGATIILKGHESVITDGKRLKFARAESAALATMGTGDILSGILGGYAALNDDMFVVGAAGACLLAKLGDELYRQKGDHGIAADLVELIPDILKKFDKNVS
ncbi:MAG: NAD(P)H-hydrate dehydratase [Candidatus Micrarchaeota archaeon]|nr:NAD(P)H-hydrate dehydratase [Candidatus Micrarchaeota archaeon]